jgi:hypothetical protein
MVDHAEFEAATTIRRLLEPVVEGDAGVGLSIADDPEVALGDTHGRQADLGRSPARSEGRR